MSQEETCVVRILNLDETFTRETLKTLIRTTCQPAGEIKNLYLKSDDDHNIFYGYVVFEHSYDAVKVKENLNGYIHTTKQFEVELIGPNLEYRTFSNRNQISVDDIISCLRCSGNHTSINCPYRKLVLTQNSGRGRGIGRGRGRGIVRVETSIQDSKKGPSNGTANNDHASRSWRVGSSYANIYISNISSSMTDADLAKLVESFGPKKKLYLGKDKDTGRCKGFAFVNFKFRSDASEAISKLNGHSHGGRILKVDWSRS